MGKLERVEDTLPTTTPAPPAPPPTKTLEERYLELQERQLAIQEEQLRVAAANQRVQEEQLKQTKSKSNKLGPDITPFNPRGEKDYPMPELKCEFWAPHKMASAVLGGLTREEVQLINMLEPGEYTIKMQDQAMQPVLVVGEMNTTTRRLDKLALMGPTDAKGQPTGLFTKDRRNRFPPLTDMLRQIVNGIDARGKIKKGPADDVLTMEEEEERVRLPKTDPLHLSVSVGA